MSIGDERMPYGIPHLIFASFLLLGGFCLRRGARKPGAMWGSKQIGTGMIAVAACLLLWAVFSEAIMQALSATVRSVRRPRVERIVAITLLPHRSGDDLFEQVVKEPLRLESRSLIEEIAHALRDAHPWHANHPDTQRLCWLAIEDRDATRYCEVSWTSNQGVIFEIYLRYSPYLTLGNALGTYRNDELGPILLRAVEAEARVRPQTTD